MGFLINPVTFSHLLILLTFAIIQVEGGVCQTPAPPNSLIPTGGLKWIGSPASVAVALAAGAEGEIYALYDSPPRVIGWNASGELLGELGSSLDLLKAPRDIASAGGGITLVIADEWRSGFIRLDRRLKELSPLEVDPAGERFEPVSICWHPLGSYFAVNYGDGDVWRIQEAGRAVRLNWSQARADGLQYPRKIVYCERLDRMFILDGDVLRIASPFGRLGGSIDPAIKSPTGMDVWETELWVAGNGVACIDAVGREVVFKYISDSPYADVLILTGDRLCVIKADGGAPQMMRIIREK